jgi:hypothetical protein
MGFLESGKFETLHFRKIWMIVGSLKAHRMGNIVKM